MQVDGDLTLQTVRAWFERTPNFGEARGEAHGEARGEACVDLANLREIDSAGLALLVHWCNRANASSNQLTFINAPRPLRQLAKISGLEELFGE